MYAVIISGRKQHRVEEGEVLKLEKLEVATGESVEFDQVLMVGEGADVKIGAPVVDGSTVTAISAFAKACAIVSNSSGGSMDSLLI